MINDREHESDPEPGERAVAVEAEIDRHTDSLRARARLHLLVGTGLDLAKDCGADVGPSLRIHGGRRRLLGSGRRRIAADTFQEIAAKPGSARLLCFACACRRLRLCSLLRSCLGSSWGRRRRLGRRGL
jgi:hypothetical protein